MRAIERLGWMLGGALFCLLLLFGCSLEEIARQESTPAALAEQQEQQQEQTGQAQPQPTQDSRAEPEATPEPGEGIGTADQRLDPTGETINAVYQKANQSVVLIEVATGRGGGIGTGFVYDKQGHIITNYHVVAGTNTQIRVTFTNQEDYMAEVVGVDQDADLAVIRVRDIDPNLLVPVELGDSSELLVGQLAIAIGNPLGEERTVTSGIISAVRAAKSETNDPQTFSIPGVIQTDAAINPGNSGGPLLDANGRVIGVNTFIANPSGLGGSIGIGFAVPVNLVKKVVPSIIENGDYTHPYLGVELLTLTRMTAEQEGLPSKGVLLANLRQGGPAAQAGLQQGDIIRSIDGEEMQTSGDVISYLEFNTSPGDTVTFQVVRRNGEEREVEVEVGARP